MDEPVSELLKIIRTNPECKIFEILHSDSDNLLEWKIKSTTLQVIPSGQGHYLTMAYRIEKNGSYEPAYIDLHTPERIVDYVLYDLEDPKYSYAHNSGNIDLIPAVACDCFGSYEVYYSRKNPELSIQVLEQGLKKSTGKNYIAEDLGYILRDENKPTEALKYFLLAEEKGASSEFIYGEIEQLYRTLGNNEKANEYQLKREEGL